ncbi:MAG: BamA/TamA family outer membrane protein [Cytophagaceae bacterium]
MRLSYLFFLNFICLIAFTSCRVTKHLEEDQYLASRQRVEGNDEVSKRSLLELSQQETNRKFLGMMPYLGIYYFGKSFYSQKHFENKLAKTQTRFEEKLSKPDLNESRINRIKSRRDKRIAKIQTRIDQGNWFMRVPGEPPAIFDTTLVNETTRQMTFYLHSKGFLRGHVENSVDTNNRRVSITYHVHEDIPFKLKEVNYETKTPSIEQLINDHKDDALIKKGQQYDESAISAERERINRLLKDNGFYDFTRQFIYFSVDTNVTSTQVVIDVIIQDPPGDNNNHKQYVISQIFFNTDINAPAELQDTVRHEGVDYIFSYPNFSRRILNHKLQMHPGDFFSQTKVQRTQRQLAMLDTYRFININFEKDTDTTGQPSLTAFINTSPLKRFQISDEIGINVVTQAFVPGPFGSISFRQRNVFGGFEILELNLRGSIDGQASVTDPTNVLRTLEYGGNISLAFPETYFPTGLRHLLHKYNPRTRLLVGYNLTDRPEYLRGNLRASMTYDWLPNQQTSYTFAIADMNVINTTIKDTAFGNYLNDLAARGNPLRESFRNAFVSSMHGSFVFNDHQFGVNRRSRFVRLFAESGGTFQNVYNTFLETDNEVLGLRAFRFIKGSADYRYYIPVQKRSTFAMRIHAGIASPYGASEDQRNVLPYEKYFFSGGSNSIRAWAPRRLGPGSFAQRNEAGEIIYTFEQPGEIVLETSLEYRFNIVGFLDWAFFLDAGNIWSIREDPTRPGAEFNPTEIAVGSGFGVRLNFNFLILRLDIGIKMYDPAEDAGEKFVAKHLVKQAPFGRRDQAVFNIGIGYPF